MTYLRGINVRRTDLQIIRATYTNLLQEHLSKIKIIRAEIAKIDKEQEEL